MKWRKRTAAKAATPEEHPEVSVTVSEETRRAQEAARVAAAQLHEVRSRAPEITATSEELASLNRRNGFSVLIRNALGSQL